MTAFTIHDVSRRCGLSGPTLRYYEQVGLVGPIDRDENSRHRRYCDLLLRHAERIEAEIVAQHARLGYLREKAALWDARDRGDTAAEADATQRARDAAGRLGELR